ncbi:hypothetical protein FAIPA1_10332 [Frankia sp. AiPs1]
MRQRRRLRTPEPRGPRAGPASKHGPPDILSHDGTRGFRTVERIVRRLVSYRRPTLDGYRGHRQLLSCA